MSRLNYPFQINDTLMLSNRDRAEGWPKVVLMKNFGILWAYQGLIITFVGTNRWHCCLLLSCSVTTNRQNPSNQINPTNYQVRPHICKIMFIRHWTFCRAEKIKLFFGDSCESDFHHSLKRYFLLQIIEMHICNIVQSKLPSKMSKMKYPLLP